MTEIKHISAMNDRAGIIGMHLNDPFSLLMDKIMGIKYDEYNAVGLYLINNSGTHDLLLYNVYDYRRVFREIHTLESIVGSTNVKYINMYSLIDDHISSGMISSRDMIHIDNSNGKIVNKFKEIFSKLVNETSNECDLHKKLWMRCVGFNEEIENGYDRVNGILNKLLGRKTKRKDNNIIHTSILKNPILIQSSNVNSVNRRFDDCLLKRSSLEMNILNKAFVDLYHDNESFKDKILSIELNCTEIFNNNENHMKNLMIKERDLINHVVGGIQHGTISNKTINIIIDDMNRIKSSIGDQILLPRSINPTRMVNITDEDILCSYQVDDAFDKSYTSDKMNMDALNHIGRSLQSIVDSYINNRPIIINLNDLIMAYNDTTPNVDYIEIPKRGKSSKIATIILSDENLMIKSDKHGNHGNHEILNYEYNDEIRSIPLHGGIIPKMTDDQMKSVLIYIDSLSDKQGYEDKQYADLQNRIVHELALRRK